jgi:serine protease
MMRLGLYLFFTLFVTMSLNLLRGYEIQPELSNYAPHVVIVKFLPEYKYLLPNSSPTAFGLSEVDRTLAAIGVKVIRPRFITNPKKYKSGLPDLSLIYQIKYEKDIPPLTAADLLLQHKCFAYAEPMTVAGLLEAPNDPNYATSTYLTSMNAEAAWNIHKGEDDTVGVILAIVDSGVKWNHQDLIANLWNNLGEDMDGDSTTIQQSGSTWILDTGDLNGIDDDGNGFVDDLIGWDFAVDSLLTQGNDPYDAFWHGTYVAGIADQRTNNGVNGASIPWNVQLMPISCNYPGSSGIYDGYNGIIYAAENGADVINCSWGGTDRGLSEEEAIQYAFGLGSIIVAAAGNSGAAILYPSAYPTVVGVTSVWNSGVKVSFSAFGVHVDVCTPSENIWTVTMNGGQALTSAGYTSYASPIAAGLTALIRSAHHDWTSEQVINQLIGTSTNLDSVNASYINQLGDGMLNAYAALSEINPTPEQELRLAFNPAYDVFQPNDANGNHALERSETFSLNLRVRNYSFGVSTNNMTCTLSTTDATVTILNNTFNSLLPSDGYGWLNNAFLCQVSATAATKYVIFSLTITADLPITTSATYTFSLLVNAGGIFVWEGNATRDNSGRFIRDWLSANGYTRLYSTTFPTSLHGFDAVFLSFGAAGSYVKRLDRLNMFTAILEYLQEGGKLYIEGNDVLGYDLAYYLTDVGSGQSAADVLWPLLGISSAGDGQSWPNIINNLAGQNATLAYGLSFYSTNQQSQYTMDKYVPSSNALPAFIESDYGCVAVQNYGSFGQKTFAFSYCLAELVDSMGAGTRNQLMQRIMYDFTTSGNTMIGIPEITVTKVDTLTVKVSWEIATNAAYYSVYESDDPYAAFPDDWVKIFDLVTDLDVDVAIPVGDSIAKFYRVTATGH